MNPPEQHDPRVASSVALRAPCEATRAHRPETRSVTHVPGLKCYPCGRLVSDPRGPNA